MHSSIESQVVAGGLGLDSQAMAPWPTLRPFGRSLELGAGKGRLFFFDSAKGDTSRHIVLLIHGLGDEGDSFRHLFPLLSEDFRLLAVDLPGFGRSTARGGTSVGLCVEAVAALLESEGIVEAIVVGSSLGASIAQLLALRCPTRVGALCLEDGGSPAPGKPPSSLLAMALPFIGRRRYEGFKGRNEAAVASLFPYYADWEGLPEADRAFLSKRVAERVASATQERAYISLLRSAMFTTMTKTRAFSEQLASWRKPMAVVWGAEDIVVPESAGRALAGQVSGSSFSLVEGAGHLPHQERPEAVAAIIRDLAARIAG